MGSQIYCLVIMVGKHSIIFIIETNVCVSVYNADYNPTIKGADASSICIVIEIILTLKFVFVKAVIVCTLENHPVLQCLQ